eukprot:CFRG6228T1
MSHIPPKNPQMPNPENDVISDDPVELAKQVKELKMLLYKSTRSIAHVRESAYDQTYFASHLAVKARGDCCSIPCRGLPPRYVKEMITNVGNLDFNPRLNTSSYVNVVSEPEEREVALLGIRVNIADQTVYPSSFKLHNDVLNMVANLWNAPKDDKFDDYGCFPGAGTVGSTEACLLAGLALKMRWRRWYAARHGLAEDEVRAVYPNLVMSDMFQACWEKFFRFMDVEPRFVAPSHKTCKVQAEDMIALCDDKTIGMVAIMGNHYTGHYDPVWEIDEALTRFNNEMGFQIGLHVDAASGGFVAPFQPEVPAWDFRCPNVLSISASGHKFGASVCGTGWVVFRERRDLSEHVAVSVSYLGGDADSYTLNFSRPASGFYVQFYKFMRLGLLGYQNLCDNMMSNAKTIRDGLRQMEHKGKARFEIMDDGEKGCLPVVAARLNPELRLPYTDIDFQHALSEAHWYVSGYSLRFEHPISKMMLPLFCDTNRDTTMFRIVVKSNLTRDLADDLIEKVKDTLHELDVVGSGFRRKNKANTLAHRPSVC